MNLNAYILAILVLLGLSAFFSASETAFTSLNTIRVKKMAADGNRKAKRVLDMADQYERLLSSILVGNNIVNITCASLGTVLFVELLGARGITVSTLVITIGTLIFGEISPKTIAKERAESIALAFSGPLYGIMLILRPVTAVFALLQNALGMLFGNQEDGGITEDELMTIVDEAEEFGNIEADERELIRSAMQFDDRIVGDIYTPRVHVAAVDETADVDEVAALFQSSGFSRLPVYHETIDNIIGLVHVKDFYGMLLQQENLPLRDLAKPVGFIMENRDLARLMTALQKDKSHMVVVTDEYGGTVGIVTMEDLIEELVGDIWDEYDEVQALFRKVAPGVYMINGQAEVEDILPRFGLKTDEIEANTVGGWLTDILGRIPRKGDELALDAFTVRVERANPRYVEELRFVLKRPHATVVPTGKHEEG